MKHLLIDIGNTKAKYCLVEDNDYRVVELEEANDALTDVHSLVVASVAHNDQAEKLIAMAKTNKIPVCYAEVAPTSFDIVCAYSKFENLGIDRWLAIVGAEQLYPDTDLVIVDAGTAMTIDFLTAQKKHLGGWIVPGLELMKTSIIEKAPKVFGDEKVENQLFGTDTPSAVFNGCLYTCVGSIRLAVDFLSKQTNSEVKLLLTGGNSKQLAHHLEHQSYLEEYLVFKGLNRFLSNK